MRLLLLFFHWQVTSLLKRFSLNSSVERYVELTARRDVSVLRPNAFRPHKNNVKYNVCVCVCVWCWCVVYLCTFSRVFCSAAGRRYSHPVASVLLQIQRQELVLRRVVETIRHHQSAGRLLAHAHGPGNATSSSDYRL